MSIRTRRSITDVPSGSGSPRTPAKSILDGSLSQSRGDVNVDLYLSLFSQLVSYSRDRVESVMALQDKLASLGYRLGRRTLELVAAREKMTKRETRLLSMLNFIALQLWTFLFGRQADSLKKVRESDSECTSSSCQTTRLRHRRAGEEAGER